jgi:hypothetical protein
MHTDSRQAHPLDIQVHHSARYEGPGALGCSTLPAAGAQSQLLWEIAVMSKLCHHSAYALLQFGCCQLLFKHFLDGFWAVVGVVACGQHPAWFWSPASQQQALLHRAHSGWWRSSHTSQMLILDSCQAQATEGLQLDRAINLNSLQGTYCLYLMSQGDIRGIRQEQRVDQPHAGTGMQQRRWVAMTTSSAQSGQHGCG